MTEITQADRDAADKIMEEVDACGCKLCSTRVCEAFARYRMEATEALRVENERLREALDRLTEASSKTLNEMVLRGNALEVLEAENKRLREALGWFLNDSRFVVQVGGNPNVVPQMIESARAALGETE